MITWRPSLIRSISILVLVGAWNLYSAFPGLPQPGGPSGGAPPPAVTAGTTVVGTVVEVNPEDKWLILRTEQGEERRLLLDIDAFVKDKNLEVGDKVEVVVRPDGRIRSLTKRSQ